MGCDTKVEIIYTTIRVYILNFIFYLYLHVSTYRREEVNSGSEHPNRKLL